MAFSLSSIKHLISNSTGPLASFVLLAAAAGLSGCDKQSNEASQAASPAVSATVAQLKPVVDDARFLIYTPVKLTADLSGLSDNQQRMVGLLIDAAEVMDGLFWRQSWGDPVNLLDQVGDPQAKQFVHYNYGPWDRLNGNKPFLSGIGPKPEGAQFYPSDMTKEEFAAWDEPKKNDQYSVVLRDDQGQLKLVPYSQHFHSQLVYAADLLRNAAGLAEDKQFAEYLRLRADALLSDNYRNSDMAWMDMKNNPIDVVIGPIENYEDQLFGYRAAFEGYVLIKDLKWSERLSRFAAFLPDLQKGLPVEEKYKRESPGTDSDLNAYDVVYYAGDCNAGSKTIAINLPNDEAVQLAKGTRRLQLKNAMRAKFDKILLPISELLISADQRQYITFDAFFANTMFHEVAHGLGIKKTVEGGENVRTALKETFSALEEGKADILGLYMITRLHEKGELGDEALMNNYVTFMASIFRSVRFGASSAHGKANMVRFNFFRDAGAFTRDDYSGQYHVDFDKMQKAMTDLSSLILHLQGDGDYEGAKKLLADMAQVDAVLQGDLNRLSEAGVPVDVVFEQGKTELGLAK